LPEHPNAAGRPEDNLRTQSSAEPPPGLPRQSAVPGNIGRYRIIRILGEGGMGTVYEAEQDQPRRNVALKVIKASLASPALLQRFEAESQALGRLHHPGIAQIYEAGSAETPFGLQPFFAMELIHGQPLTQYANKRKLNLRQRLSLMIQVCDAAQHAHQRGIIHRDLKPGNILVDETGQPKILDFGLARATDCDAEATRQTDVGQILGTLAYMSPEQVLADPLALDTRSDVYALGVVLYELLADKLPYQLSRQVPQAIRVIQEIDPSPLSSVSRVYRGDIETIVAKALEKDKNRRYASAADLAGDIRRYLDDRPITAKPASASYQLKKFAKRHKALVAGVAAVFVALVLGVIVSTSEAVRAHRAEHTAQQQTEIARAVNDFLQKDLLAQAGAYGQAGADSQSKPDPDMKVRTALDRAAHNISGKFKQQPEVEAAIRETIGSTYYDLGLFAEARPQLERALELGKAVWGSGDQRTIKTMLFLASTEEDEGKFNDAEAVAKQAIEISRRTLGPEHAITLDSMNRLTSIYDMLGKYSEGESLGTQAADISRRVNGPEAKITVDCMFFLAIIYYEEGKYALAETMNQQVLDIRRRVLGPDHPDTLNAMNNLAATYLEGGKVSQAEALNKQLIESRRRALGAEHPDTLDAMVNLGFDYRVEKRYKEAEALDRQVLEIQRRVLGAEHPLTLRSTMNVASDMRALGHAAEAETIDNQTFEIRRRVLGPEAPDTLSSMASLAEDYRSDHKYEQALALDEKTEEIRARVLGPQNPATLESVSALADDYKELGEYSKAESEFRKACEGQPDNPVAFSDLAWFLLIVPDPQLRRPQEALDLARKSVKLAGENAGKEYNTLGLALVRNQLWTEAVAILKKSVELNKATEPADFFLLATAYQKSGARADAERDLALGADLVQKATTKDSDARELWAEAAKTLGKPIPPQ